LPPIDASIIASRVVGTCTNGDAAHEGGGHEAGEVAHHAAAERHHRGVAPVPGVEQRVGEARPALPRLVVLAGRHREHGHARVRAEAGARALRRRAGRRCLSVTSA
jgi:hypothetical protein